MAAKRDWKALGCAALLGALVAFPAGVITARRQQPDAAAGMRKATTEARPGRDLYSPTVLKDPYVVEQQRRVVEALELNCRQFRENCEEARLARLRLEEAAD